MAFTNSDAWDPGVTLHGMGDRSMHASSLGLFVANWGKWSFTLNPLLALAYILNILCF